MGSRGWGGERGGRSLGWWGVVRREKAEAGGEQGEKRGKQRLGKVAEERTEGNGGAQGCGGQADDRG